MFEKLRDKVKNLSVRAKSAIASGAVGAVAIASNTMTAMASEESSGLKEAMSTAFNGVKSDALDFFSVALPVALSIMGVVIAVKLGIKFFKKFANG